MLESPTQTPRRTKQSADRRCVLLVDDDPDLRLGAEARLTAAGYRTAVADNGADGVAAAIAERPDAILLDIRMRDGDGLQTLEELRRRKETRDIPVLMLSACVAAQQEAFEKGARFFLTKPYDGATLLAAIDSAITESEQG